MPHPDGLPPLRIGETVWSDVVVVDVNGPWSNVVHQKRIVKRGRFGRGKAPPMRQESFADYGYRCERILKEVTV